MTRDDDMTKDESHDLPPPQIYECGSDSRLLRNALGCFATGVCVLTAMDQHNTPVGLTLNSFTSVSLDPPLVLACIARTVSSLDVLEAGDHFAINVLQNEQQDISRTFASRVEDRFSQLSWAHGTNGAPIIDNIVASIECTRHAIHDGGDHIILVGRVDRASFDPHKQPLLYYRGNYRNLGGDSPEKKD